ncbi:hypothetical protein [Alkalitalea saponilacus]|uniref:Uncharacterized protein n=1 Tax=Alkalitalea saponilacus TaxID=889453 RepID=A0A1T5HUH7_9BACT|nr:hypothetical protein [Alkalitalea saponilacus]ASB50500.1 hypothetical protein CDL62_15755 [Alkalitalea saponilacus]SKC24325.1 hypothetical protein SAMN03080601_03627 [Alkalitalea saponilacus]
MHKIGCNYKGVHYFGNDYVLFIIDLINNNRITEFNENMPNFIFTLDNKFEVLRIQKNYGELIEKLQGFLIVNYDFPNAHDLISKVDELAMDIP